MSKKYLIVVGGPTASGKTSVAIEIARYFGAQIISADSRQFYREMGIGTAKPSVEELNEIPHHFINSLNISQSYSVGDYERDAIQLLNKYFLENNVAVLAGGSGLFIRAVCEGLDEFPDVHEDIIKDLNLSFETNGIEHLQEELKAKDPTYYSEVDLANPHRILRALSVIRASGMPFSSFRNKKSVKRGFEPIFILLERDRSELYERINLRVEQMVENGLIEEAKGLFANKHLKSLQTVGYQELFDHFAGKYSLAESLELIKRNSRRYAKRQMTWFRKREHWNRFHPDNSTKIIEFLKKTIGTS